jgi:hypothetical protein
LRPRGITAVKQMCALELWRTVFYLVLKVGGGIEMRGKHRGWSMPQEDAQRMLRLIEERIAASEPFREVLILDQRLGPRRRSMRRIMARRTNAAALRA